MACMCHQKSTLHQNKKNHLVNPGHNSVSIVKSRVEIGFLVMAAPRSRLMRMTSGMAVFINLLRWEKSVYPCVFMVGTLWKLVTPEPWSLPTRPSIWIFATRQWQVLWVNNPRFGSMKGPPEAKILKLSHYLPDLILSFPLYYIMLWW